MSKGIKAIEIQRVEGDKLESRSDAVSIEEPLEIRILQGDKTHPISVTMRTPGHDAELALGFAHDGSAAEMITNALRVGYI